MLRLFFILSCCFNVDQPGLVTMASNHQMTLVNVPIGATAEDLMAIFGMSRVGSDDESGSDQEGKESESGSDQEGTESESGSDEQGNNDDALNAMIQAVANYKQTPEDIEYGRRFDEDRHLRMSQLGVNSYNFQHPKKYKDDTALRMSRLGIDSP